MNYLDLYLRKNNCKRYDIHKKTGVSQQLLSNHTKRSVEKYSGKVIIAIASTINKTPGDVLNDLLAL
ncbi:helix-turn-helix domain-containing protein [Terrisporobacter petrolearius]|uniref:helix-turn-helix domain-containing protein n=1 Tax=Terrisporobacter petrolearius TaxID=1460447 RepID=UPI003B008C1B